MSNRGATFGAEESVNGVAGRALAGPLLDGPIDGELVFGNDGDESYEF